MNIVKDYRFIPEYEDESQIVLLVPENYNFLHIEEIRFLTGKNVIIKKFQLMSFQNYFKKNCPRKK